MRLERRGECSVCGSSENMPDMYSANSIGLMPPLGISKCLNCDFRWQNPRVTEDCLMELYAGSYFEGDPSSHELLGRYVLPPEETRTFSVTHSNQKYQQQLKHIKILQSLDFIEGKHLLEIGSGRGGFLELTKTFGVLSTGIEPSRIAAAEARNKGLNVYTGTIEDLPCEVGTRKWDIVYLSHVFEHFYNPAQALTVIEGLLSENGYVFIEVPNQFEAWAKRVSNGIRALFRISRPSTIYSVHHISFFSLDTLKRILMENGFEAHGGCWSPRSVTGLGSLVTTIIGCIADLLSDQGGNVYVVAKKCSDKKI